MPGFIRPDNRPELASKVARNRRQPLNVQTLFIAPGLARLVAGGIEQIRIPLIIK